MCRNTRRNADAAMRRGSATVRNTKVGGCRGSTTSESQLITSPCVGCWDFRYAALLQFWTIGYIEIDHVVSPRCIAQGSFLMKQRNRRRMYTYDNRHISYSRFSFPRVHLVGFISSVRLRVCVHCVCVYSPAFLPDTCTIRSLPCTQELNRGVSFLAKSVR